MTTTLFPLFPSVNQNPLASPCASTAIVSNAVSHCASSFMQLNTNASKAIVEQAIQSSKEVMAAKSPQEWFTIMLAQIGPAMERTSAYQKYVESIVSATQSELSSIADNRDQIPEKSTATDMNTNDAQTLPSTMSGMGIVQAMLSSKDGGYGQMMKGMEAAMAAMKAPGNFPFNPFLPK
jgi:phasin family protein